VVFEARIVGTGPLRGDLRGLADSLGIIDRVTFLGARTQMTLLDEYATAQAFALAPVVTADGDRDGIPNVLTEAMASGIPVISSRISGIPELIRDGVNGVLVPPCDPRALADGLHRLLADSSEAGRLGSAGRAWVRSHRDLRTCVVPLAQRLDAAIRADTALVP
jgi:glycosyltransferase involved in cell wall biosynthesis